MPLDKPLSPQGYNIGVDPTNTNPFFEGAPGGGGGGEGVTEYNKLTGRPFINGKVLEGNKDLKLTTPEELQATKTELTSSVTQEEEARIAEDEAIRQEIKAISLTPGPPGSDGTPGKAATIHVGATETVEPGTPASVTNTGTENAAVLTFKIPRGNTGAPGADGRDGAPGKDFTYEDFTSEQLEALRGPQGIQGVPGSDGATGVAGRIESVSAETVPYTEEASVQNTGTEENAILHFKIPQGIPGTSGGEGGATVTVNVGTTTTGEPGTNAEVTNRGTEENVVLDFKIPRGNTGAPGTDGRDGAPGKDFTYEDFTPEQLEALRGPQGLQGAPGSDGAPGVAGKAATIRVGGTETLEPGSVASVENSGTENAAVLTFKIPRGNAGAPGTDGRDGAPGKDFTYEDFTPEQLEALRGPQGLQGVPGSDGAPGVAGKAATIRVGTVTTLPAGSDATVTNSGTENTAIFNFGIPKGADGTGGGGSGEFGLTLYKSYVCDEIVNSYPMFKIETLPEGVYCAMIRPVATETVQCVPSTFIVMPSITKYVRFIISYVYSNTGNTGMNGVKLENEGNVLHTVTPTIRYSNSAAQDIILDIYRVSGATGAAMVNEIEGSVMSEANTLSIKEPT